MSSIIGLQKFGSRQMSNRLFQHVSMFNWETVFGFSLVNMDRLPWTCVHPPKHFFSNDIRDIHGYKFYLRGAKAHFDCIPFKIELKESETKPSYNDSCKLYHDSNNIQLKFSDGSILDHKTPGNFIPAKNKTSFGQFYDTQSFSISKKSEPGGQYFYFLNVLLYLGMKMKPFFDIKYSKYPRVRIRTE